MRFPRTSGILLAVTSLPSRFAIGDLGPGATSFINFLASGGQGVWQVLPLGPPAIGGSPYSCYSAFAGSPMLISPEQMVADHWLTAVSLDSLPPDNASSHQVDYDLAALEKSKLLEMAFQQSKDRLTGDADYVRFCEANAFWLEEFSFFEALMHFFADPDWLNWPQELVERHPVAMTDWKNRLAWQIEKSKFLQYVFEGQWKRVKRYANDRGIRIFGDMPIFVARESADVWANQRLFCLDESGNPTFVAGVPPDYFAVDGQRWGNPLYRWEVLEAEDYAWWTQRFAAAFHQFDWLRVDHFRGFESFWEIPAECETARDGKWVPGPGAKPFVAAQKVLGPLPIVAEDLGMITEAVHELRDELEFPAMRVMQFGFDNEDDVFHHPDHNPEHSVAYTGTHDNDTIMGWYAQRQIDAPENRLLDEIVTNDVDIHWQLIASVLKSQSDVAIIPMQDLLGLGSEARMNIPGQAQGNWTWRVTADSWTPEVSERLRTLCDATHRKICAS
jgi:4-alpha-glucanotransferase